MPSSGMQQVVIEVRGGMAYVSSDPPGVEVVIIDHDIHEKMECPNCGTMVSKNELFRGPIYWGCRRCMEQVW